jgi:hypothetical protein
LRESLLLESVQSASWSNWLLVPVAVVYILIGSLLLFNRLSGKSEVLRPVQRILPVVSAYRLVNSYGLFASLTTERPEIILEGSNDGRSGRLTSSNTKRGFAAPSTGRSAAPTKAGLADVVCGAATTPGGLVIRLVERLFTNEPAVTSCCAQPVPRPATALHPGRALRL